MKMRMKGSETGKEPKAEDAVYADAAGQSAAAAPEVSGGSEDPTDSLPGNSEAAAAPEDER